LAGWLWENAPNCQDGISVFKAMFDHFNDHLRFERGLLLLGQRADDLARVSEVQVHPLRAQQGRSVLPGQSSK